MVCLIYTIGKLGHGTAVADVLTQNSSVVNFYCIKIYSDSLEADPDLLLYAMNYVLINNIPCDIMLISSGITYFSNSLDMMNIVNNLYARHVIIVSAFDNDGSISYPAVLNNVIGVGITSEIDGKPQVFINNTVNVVLPKKFYRLKWVSPPNIIISGSSFAAGYIILCVNPHDPIEYIERSLNYLNFFNKAPVIAFVVLPIMYEAANKIGYGYKKKKLKEDDLIRYKNYFYNELKIPTYTLNTHDIDDIFNNIIDELSE